MTFYESQKKRKRRGRRSKTATASWLFLLGSAAVLFISFCRFPFSPNLARIALFVFLAVIVGILGLFSLRNNVTGRQTVVSVLNVMVGMSLLVVGLVLPVTKADINRIFKDIPEVEESRIAVYALTTDYKAANIETFRSSGYVTAFINLKDYRNLQFITQTAVDQENQAYAIEKIAEKLEMDSLWLNETGNLWEAVEALYNGNGQALIMNTAYAETVAEEYPNFLTDTFIVDSFVKATEREATKPIDVTKDPFTVFVAGSDSRDAQLGLRTRTDVDIIMTVNPNTKQIMICSLPRDSYIANPAMDDSYDKLTHMGIYTINNSLKALSQYLDIDLERYLLVNFTTYQKIVDALGGVDIENPYEFKIGKTVFPAGPTHLNGENALSYVRARYDLPNGDISRNEHQIIVLRAIIQKILSPEIVGNFTQLMDALNGTFLTNISTDSIWDFANMQINDMASWDIIQYHIGGTSGGAECASMPGRQLSVVFPNENQISYLKGEIQKMMENQKITQETLQ